jgi:hypothetical protein
VEYADNLDTAGEGHIKNEVRRETGYLSPAHAYEPRYAGIIGSAGGRMTGKQSTRLIDSQEIPLGHCGGGLLC